MGEYLDKALILRRKLLADIFSKIPHNPDFVKAFEKLDTSLVKYFALLNPDYTRLLDSRMKELMGGYYERRITPEEYLEAVNDTLKEFSHFIRQSQQVVA